MFIFSKHEPEKFHDFFDLKNTDDKVVGFFMEDERKFYFD